MNHDSNLEDTLEDGAWKDSFDKILEPKAVPVKQNVRVSFNMDSSVENENSNYESFLREVLTYKIPKPTPPKVRSSEPVKIKWPFKCSISPVGLDKYKLSHILPQRGTIGLTATPIHSFEEIEYEEESDHAKSLDKSKNNGTLIIREFMRNQKLLREARSKMKKKSTSILEVSPKSNQVVARSRPRPTRQVCFDVQDDSSICEVASVKEEEKPKSLPLQAGRRQVCFDVGDDSSICEVVVEEKRPTSLTLQPGKWRKSLNVWRRTNHLPSKNRQSLFYMRRTASLAPREDSCAQISFLSEMEDWCKGVLKYCKQSEPHLFASVYAEENLKFCRKIGEGAFGEVFINSQKPKKCSINDVVYKIIPIEGELDVNGEPQKTFQTIFPEIVISTELSNLSQASSYSTENFVKIDNVKCVKGRYPSHLISLWEKYDEEKGSDNDHPSLFDDQQLFIVLELAYSGIDMETFKFQNAEQGYYALLQIIVALAVAEEAFEFEHRDLHLGNLLILHTKQQYMTAKLQGKSIRLTTKGIKVTIIDYTLSRMTFLDGCLYNDVSSDEALFNAVGDYQFDIYRMMRKELNNNWQLYEPKTNIFWISYIISKLLNGITYTCTRTKAHEKYKKQLEELQEIILTFKSASECASYLFKLHD